MAKRGVLYGFQLNDEALPFSESHTYPLMLTTGENRLTWFIVPSKQVWAYQVDIAVDGTVTILERRSGESRDAVPPVQVQKIRVEG